MLSNLVRSVLILLLFFPIALPADNPVPAPVANEGLEHVQTIFQRLIEAKGDKRMKPPTLKWSFDVGQGAFYDPNTKNISFEETAYKVCKSFGDQADDAIAYILSHELIHYYKQHGWEAAFAKQFSGRQIATDVDEDLRDIKQQETESDLLGGFLAYTAGYNTVGIAPEFLPKLYDAYPNWPKGQNPKYPTLEERVLLAQSTQKELEQLIEIFETANMLTAIEHYADAIDYFNYILSLYQSRELKNNMGVLHCMLALKEFLPAELKYCYPLEIDGEARLRYGTRGTSGAGTGNALRDSLLQVGLNYFQEAIDLDADYQVARLNLGNAHALLALSNKGAEGAEELVDIHFEFARAYAKQVRRLARQQDKKATEANGAILLGIIAAEQGDSVDAVAYFKLDTSRLLSKANLNILQGRPPLGPVGQSSAGFLPEEIDGFSLDDFIRAPAPDGAPVTVKGTQNRKWGIKTSGLTNSKILLDFLKKDQYAFFHLTSPGYAGETNEGIKLGMSQNDILKAYKYPERVVQLSQGELLVYPAHQIMFFLDPAGKLTKWCVFRMKPDPE
ncbi:MAG: hypothetical protein KDC32_18155 [Saprospiraceae bacterium]|nr:hypothetical protein [Saprospiraceae bacterium]MCB0682801.1 hypothetical protein [Saprospiraceae bacterium]